MDVSSVSNATFTIIQTSEILGRDAPSRARRLIKSGDVIFATIRPTLKRIATIPHGLDGEVCSTAYFVFRTRPALSARFLFYYLFTDEFMGAMGRLQTGASYPAVNDTQVKAQKIAFPGLSDQTRIVGILDEAFVGIDTAVANTEKNLANARELFDSYLNSAFNFTGELVKLSDLATDVTDGDHSPPPKAPSGIPFITISDVDKSARKIDFSNTFFVPREYFDGLKPNKKPRIGDVLYTVTGATLGIPVLVETDAAFCFQRHIGLIRPKPEINSAWLSYALSSQRVFSQATVGSTGAAQKTVSLAVLRTILLPKVPGSEQRVIAHKLDQLNADAQKLEVLFRRKLTVLSELSTPFPKYGDVFCADSGRYDQSILVEEDVACRGGARL